MITIYDDVTCFECGRTLGEKDYKTLVVRRGAVGQAVYLFLCVRDYVVGSGDHVVTAGW